MLSPYRIVEETDEFVVYEFRAIYLYLLYGCLVPFAVGCVVSIDALEIAGGVLIVLYFLLISTQVMRVNKKIKRAAREASVEVSGSKWSFSNPLRVKIRKEFI